MGFGLVTVFTGILQIIAKLNYNALTNSRDLFLTKAHNKSLIFYLDTEQFGRKFSKAPLTELCSASDNSFITSMPTSEEIKRVPFR
jgi:hypothetical protein